MTDPDSTGNEHLQPAAPPPATVTAAPRLTMVDTFRGISILEVVTHHTTGVGLKYATQGTLLYDILLILNRTLHFAVPAFLFLSAVVLTQSLLKRFDMKRYFWRRVSRSAWPYLLWSTIYVFWYVYSGQRPVETLYDPERWLFYFQYGKASYHLYFLLVALEAYIVLPLLLPLARKKPSFSAVLIVGLLLQMGIYLLNRSVLHVRFPASTIFWYMLPLFLGAAVGARFNEYWDWWKNRWGMLMVVLFLVYFTYMPLALNYVKDVPVTPVIYSGLSWAFTALMALTIMGLAFWVEKKSPLLKGVLATLGTVTLPIYLIHPALLQAAAKYAPPLTLEDPNHVAQTLVGYWLFAMIVPYAIGRLLLGTKLGLLLFGR